MRSVCLSKDCRGEDLKVSIRLSSFRQGPKALLVISAVTLLASADKPSSVESKPVKTVPSKVSKPVTKVIKSEAKEPKAPSVSTRQQKKYPLKPIPRKYPIHPSQFKSSRLHRLAKKSPIFVDDINKVEDENNKVEAS